MRAVIYDYEEPDDGTLTYAGARLFDPRQGIDDAGGGHLALHLRQFVQDQQRIAVLRGDGF